MRHTEIVADNGDALRARLQAFEFRIHGNFGFRSAGNDEQEQRERRQALQAKSRGHRMGLSNSVIGISGDSTQATAGGTPPSCRVSGSLLQRRPWGHPAAIVVRRRFLMRTRALRTGDLASGNGSGRNGHDGVDASVAALRFICPKQVPAPQPCDVLPRPSERRSWEPLPDGAAIDAVTFVSAEYGICVSGTPGPKYMSLAPRGCD